jgi:hypothetical protein
MQAVSESCVSEFEECFGQGVTMFDIQVCGFEKPQCLADVDSCADVEIIEGGDGSECYNAGDCEIVELTMPGPDGLETTSGCLPAYTLSGGAARAAFNCYMDAYIEIMTTMMESMPPPTCNFGALMVRTPSRVDPHLFHLSHISLPCVPLRAAECSCPTELY